MMDATFEFSVNGLNIEFAISLIADGRDVPNGLFVDILTEKYYETVPSMIIPPSYTTLMSIMVC